MTPLIFREMKELTFSCLSPSSAATCTSVDRRPIARPSIGRTIDRHLRGSRRANALNPLSQLPSKPKSYTQKIKTDTEEPAELISPAGSSRYLLNNTAFFDAITDPEPLPALLNIEPSGIQSLKRDETDDLRPSSSSTRSQDQVVVLRVSLHCKGCEGKVRRHLSKMEGVTSFNIDFATKKVTVIGNVTPLGVLNSVSKVKKAQFWPSTPSSSPFF